MNHIATVDYDSTEERLNVLTHGIGAVIACIASAILLYQQRELATGSWLSLWVYCFGLIFVLSSSTLYHWSKTPKQRRVYKKLDHTAIYYLIAGTYTPLLYINIPTTKAHYILISLWVITAIGTIFKIFFAHRFGKVSLIAYVSMGWFAILMFKDMQTYLKPECLQLLVIGGIAYTVGAIFYALKRVRFTHAIWHVFVLIGAGAHFLAIAQYGIT
ncbi:hemolysin III family protein [Acinetobacter sp. B5B]|uniref:PAQR family membrane homeostasis protein TrhA n=1 Tax=Acinetobacter baretiae TaxID=2605383 RepID=UPI0018C32A27|nr:hemolysin III family protein [Acinetobacter baretiae]MBF7683224.1 hemolysin III family protein [Acinetobacter baretiae]